MTGLLLAVLETQYPQGRLSSMSQMQELKAISQRIKAVLEDAEQTQPHSEAMKAWPAELKNIHYDLIDLFDECCIFEEYCLSSFSFSFFKLIIQYIVRRYTAPKIPNLIKKMQLAREYASYLPRGMLDGHESWYWHSEFRGPVHPVKKMVYGRDSERRTLTSELLSENYQEHGIKYLSIVGIGGIGKTALAKLIYDSEQVKEHFDLRVWVIISTVDIKWIVTDILESVTNEYYQMNDAELEVLVQRCHQTFEGKRCLIVLDDMWDEERSHWEALNRLFYGHAASGSAILITTRSTRVAQAAGSAYTMLGGLSEKESLSLFWHFALPADTTEIVSTLEEVGRQIVIKCQGMPLAIISFGSLLRYKKTVQEWQKVLLEFEKFSLGDYIWPIFMLSYSHLPPPLGRCLLYCSLFPKNHPIDVNKLMKLWMAQNYSDYGKDDMEIKAWLSFDQLLSLSFFHDLRRDENGNLLCSMGGLLTDFVKHLAEKECSTVRVDTEVTTHITHKIRKLFHLRYLDFSFNRDLKELPEALCDLSRLQSLNLNGCDNLQRLPNGIGKLIFLRHFEILWTKSLSYLPKGIGSLTSLRTLNRFFGNGVARKKACNLGDLEKLSHLQGYISIDGLGGVTNVALAKKADLKNKKGLLGMDVWFTSAGSSNPKDGAVLDALRPPPNLKTLGIFCYKGTSFPHWMATAMQLRHLMLSECIRCESLPPLGKLPVLETLEIRDMISLKILSPEFLGIELERGDGGELVSTRRSDSSCGGKKVGPAVRAGGGGSRGKEIISDSDDGGEEVISATGSNSDVGGYAVFPMLKKLHFCNMANWEQWDEITQMEGNVTIMPLLSSLSIVRCTKLRAVPDYIKRIENLSCQIEDCPLLKEEKPKEN